MRNRDLAHERARDTGKNLRPGGRWGHGHSGQKVEAPKVRNSRGDFPGVPDEMLEEPSGAWHQEFENSLHGAFRRVWCRREQQRVEGQAEGAVR